MSVRNRIRISGIAIFSILFLFSSVIYGQLREANPSEEGFSTERLARLTKMIEGYTDHNHEVSGVVSLVTRHGKIVYYNASGFSDIESGKKSKTDDIFRIASQTKSITGAAIMILYEDGKLLLNDPISKYAPEFKNMQVVDTFNEKDSTYTTVPAKREIKFQDLLTHTSGFGYPGIGDPMARAIYAKAKVPVGLEYGDITLAEGMKRLAQTPLMHQPGAKFTYGLSIDVLGYLVEKISGQSFKDFLQERIFKPLGLKDTYFYLPRDKQSRLVQVCGTDKSGKRIPFAKENGAGTSTIYPLSPNAKYYSGGAGLSSTALDYSIFLCMLINGGTWNGVQILSPSTVKMMTTNQIDKTETDWTSQNNYGYTFEIATEQGSLGKPWGIGSYSWGGYWGSHFWVDPVNDITVQIMTNDPGSKRAEMVQKFRSMLYSALVNP